MSLNKTQSLTGKYFLGLGVAIILGIGAYLASEHSPKSIIQGLRGIAADNTPNELLRRLNQRDRTRLRSEVLMNGVEWDHYQRRCFTDEADIQGHINRASADPSHRGCGAFSDWRSGNVGYNRFRDPFMAQIPPGTKTEVYIECNPETHQFEMKIKLKNVCPNSVKDVSVTGREENARINYTITRQPNCTPRDYYFQNPYAYFERSHLGDYSEKRLTPFSNTPEVWRTSPGKWNDDDKTELPPVLSNTTGAGADLHIVSDRKAWEGAAMKWTIWLKGDFAIHSGPTSGFTESKGCIRLDDHNAQGLYNLVKQVGTDNLEIHWGGYGPPLADQGGRPACSFTQDEYDQKLAKGVPVQPETPVQAERRSLASDAESSAAFDLLKTLHDGNFTVNPEAESGQ